MVSVGRIEVDEVDGIVSVPAEEARVGRGTAVVVGRESLSRSGVQAGKIQPMTKTNKINSLFTAARHQVKKRGKSILPIDRQF